MKSKLMRKRILALLLCTALMLMLFGKLKAA